MPQHNTNGMSKSGKKRYAKGGSSPGEAKHAATVARLKKLVTTNFHKSHVALTTNPNFTAELGNASRPIDSSTCLILTPADLARFESMVKARRAKIVSGDHPNRSRIYTSEKIFKMMTWGHQEKERLSTVPFPIRFYAKTKAALGMFTISNRHKLKCLMPLNLMETAQMSCTFQVKKVILIIKVIGNN